MALSRSLHIGINYPGSGAPLAGCINDAENLAEFVVSKGLVAKDHVTVLREATCSAIVTHLQRLARDSRKYRLKNVFISYSGHGVSVPDSDGDEKDGCDECICPTDYRTAGVISDDVLKALLRKFYKSTKVTVLMDCCHSGSILDLPTSYKTSTSYSQECSRTACHPKVVMISGCKDCQTSADAFDRTRDESTGAMTSCFLDAVSADPHVLVNSYHLLICMRVLLRERRMQQVPQLSTSYARSTKPLPFLWN